MLLEADQVDAASLEAVDGLEMLAQRASQTVEPGDAQAVTGSGVVDELARLHRFAVPDRGYSVFSCANSLFYREAAVETPL